MVVPKFSAKIKNGKVALLDKDRFVTHVSGLKDGEYYIVIDKEKDKRTSSQNKYLWGVLYKIPADALGWDIDDMHEWCKLQFNPKQSKINDEDVVIPGSTAKLTVTEFNDYKDKIQRFFAEHDINIPDPNETI